MGIGGSGFAYDAVRMTARAVEDRRANRAYWRELRRRRRVHVHAHTEAPAGDDLSASIAKQLDAEVHVASTRRCPQCRDTFILLRVGQVDLDACLNCGSFWMDKGELTTLVGDERATPAGTPIGPSSYQCPVCHAPMVERSVPGPLELRIDACPKDHGIYLERDELSKMLATPRDGQAGEDSM